MAYKIFIDGKEGTTGLQIFDRFSKRKDIELLQISQEDRKNPAIKKELINSADYVFLCLPDTAAIQSVALCENPHTKILDSSTAHRTAPEWDYGFPELDTSFRCNIQKSKRVAVPGCYASGFVSICYPLVKSTIMPKDYPLLCHAVSGYSGAGKKAIAQYQEPKRPSELETPRLYALSQNHKHLKEMQKIAGIDFAPIFCPYICDYYSGMSVTVCLFSRLLKNNASPKDIHSILTEHYAKEHFVTVAPLIKEEDAKGVFIAANDLCNTNNMKIYVGGNKERIQITCVFDNLGKGASGAAVQCMNIMMGIDETTGL